MSKRKPTPKERGEQRKEAQSKKEASSQELQTQHTTTISRKQEMTVEEFSEKRTEIAIKLITDSLETPNSRQLEKVVLEMSSIGLPKIPNFTDNFVEKYPDPMFQNQIFEIVLRKIEVSNSPETLNALKSEILLAKAKAIMAMNLSEERTQIKLENAHEALTLLESANVLQNPKIAASIEETVKTLITTHPDPLEAFQLAQYSVEFRKGNLETGHPSTLEAYVISAQIGHTIGERAVKIEAMQNADIAYNMALQLGNKAHAALALKFLAKMYEDFSDFNKTSLLLEQAASLEPVVIDDSKEKDQIPGSKPHSFQIIRTHGVSDDLTLTIKQKIQDKVLNPIYEASKQGKWIWKMASIEYGVSGYLDDKFLTKTLGPVLATPENIKCALMLCFEAINLGIMSNPIKNPLCGVIFVQQYPELITTILTKHPEYFVDEHIFKAALLNGNNNAAGLLEAEVAPNGSYNVYLETIMMPIIADRLSDSVLTPVSNLIKSGKWDSVIQSQLLTYASDHYLTGVGSIYTSTLGQNLSALEDALNIARILIFKEVLDAITESGSKNYAPVEALAKSYTDVVKRVLADHPDYVTNSHIIDICSQISILPQLPEIVDPIQENIGEVAVIGEGEVVSS